MNKDQATNLSVWARRMGIVLDIPKSQAFLATQGLGGSVLRGPLMVIAAKSCSSAVLPEHKKAFAVIFADAVSSIVRKDLSEKAGLHEATTNSPHLSEIFKIYEKELTSLISKAIKARRDEKEQPRLANLILNQVHGRNAVVRREGIASDDAFM